MSRSYQQKVVHSDKKDFEWFSNLTSNQGLPFSRPGLLPLSHDSTIIPPPVPESIPTTPDAEITLQMFNSYNDPPPALPQYNVSVLRARNRQESDVLSTPEVPPMTLNNPPKNLHRVIAACTWCFCCGFSDGAPGGLLPTIEAYYNVSYTMVSLIWMASALGFILVAFLSSTLSRYLGKRTSLCVGIAFQVAMYAMVSPGGPFEVTVVAFFFCGTGLAICSAQLNIFLSRLDHSATYLGYFHGCYGAGATVAPLISKSMVNAGVKWSYFYAILLGLAFCNVANFWVAFEGADEDLKPWEATVGETPTQNARDEEQAEISLVSIDAWIPNNSTIAPDCYDIGYIYTKTKDEPKRVRVGGSIMDHTDTKDCEFNSQLSTNPTTGISGYFQDRNETNQGSHNEMAAPMTSINYGYEMETPSVSVAQSASMAPSLPLIPTSRKESLTMLVLKDIPLGLLCLFSMFYTGGEVALGGWVVTFLLRSRNGNPRNIEYVASGFWAGLTIGRLGLTRLGNRYLGGRRGVIVFMLLAIIFGLLTWLVLNVVVAGLCVGLCGMAIGPVYPLMITVATRHFPRKVLVVALTINTAMGSAGGALFPFLVGLLSQYVGTYVVMPVFIGLFSACLGFWLVLPNIDRNVKTAWWHHVW
ncbi:hypothetical protein BABINDRAFT_154987 [Babjeviella inositovora NRRL Y-12698]|uniref:Major facilitator superfamily (MFS) profile domain-containing protein n=1 Tax=Babjeviella inositovora NRRL Y-12698 TaxID=984486 RepID=A0A1E3QMQ6_9ASCO|nr:uncharacterized protein BABINDRAFT_154987 [Babjeviella inositovora NRRL Y-12698]ODQ78918.1 hypothetical protein BABINDRAFT_154987 [Babjeviella inositovora NRRL Y-12698]